MDCGNLLTGDLPPELGNLASLGVVNLGGTRLTGCIPSALREPLEKAHSDFGGLQYCPTTIDATPTPSLSTPAPTPTPEPPLFDFPWARDGLTDTEQDAVRDLQSIQREHPAIAQVVLGFPWVADGITQQEAQTLETIWRLSEQDSSLIRRIATIPWLADSITWQKHRVLGMIGRIVSLDVDLTDPTLNTLLFVDGPIDALRFGAIVGLDGITKAGRLELLTSQPWFRDGLTDEEYILIAVSAQLRGDEQFFRELVQSPHIWGGLLVGNVPVHGT